MSKLTNLVLHIQAALEEQPLAKEKLSERIPQKEAASGPVEKEHTLTKKELVLEAVHKRSREIQVDDLPQIENEMLVFFKKYRNGDYFNNLNSEDYYRLLDLKEQPDTRVVVVGDIHCDFKSLAAILFKLSVSSYDYYEKGVFVFMGDYLDRGAMLFEPLLLLMDLKQILGDRMIMLRGNHELISYNKDSQLLEGRVVPQDSVPCLNEYCGENKTFLEAFGYFYQTLPTYVYLKVKDQNVLLTHGSIPRQMFLNAFRFDQETGAIAFEREFLYEEDKKVEKSITDDSLKTKTAMLNANLLLIRNKILYDMIWGDPSNDEEKYQVAGRFQFGSKQFDAYVKKNRLSRIFRSHEPIEYGFKSFFDNRLYTIFSTGGSQNDQAGYADVQPAFAVINTDGSYKIENSYIYLLSICGAIDLIADICTEEIMGFKAFSKYSLNEEFGCSAKEIFRIQSLFADMNKGFTPLEETDIIPEEAAEPETEEPAKTESEEPIITESEETVEASEKQDNKETKIDKK